MKRAIVLLLVGCVIGLAVWWQGVQARRVSALTNDGLVVYGNVDIRQVELAFRVGGRIAAELVDEGDAVTAGQLLARLDAQPAADTLAQAAAELRVQEAGLAKMRAGYRREEVAQARAARAGSAIALDSATRTLDRLLSLHRTRAVSQQAIDDARASHAQSKARFEADDEQMRLMDAGYRREDVAAQEAAVEAARAALAAARTAFDDTALHAPQAGIVLTRVRETGAIVQPGQTVFTLTLSNPAWVRAFVTQPHLGLVKPGQSVWLEVDAAPGKRFAGKVGYISPQAEFAPKTVETREVRNDLVFRFRVLAEDPANVLRQGMPVTVIIPFGREADGHAAP